MKRQNIRIVSRIAWVAGLMLLINSFAIAQEMPPRPMAVSIVRNLNFGAFTQGVSGGSIIIYPSGSRISAGDIILVNFGYLYYPAIFELSGNPGTIIHYLAGNATVLTGNNGGTMSMTLGDTEPITPFILPSAGYGTLQVFIGGTLTVGSPLANPVGEYTGTFDIMFIQE